MLDGDEFEQIPTRYRLLIRLFLKLPNPSLPFFILKHFPEFEGIFWALVMPIFMAMYVYLFLWLIPFLTLTVGFPLNIIFGYAIPAIIFVFFLRIQLERTILWWRNIHKKPREWQTSKRVEELIELLNRQQNRKKS